MKIELLPLFCISFVLSAAFTLLVKKAALVFGILDRPGPGRKVHSKPVPLMGGAAVFAAFFISLLLAKEHILAGNLSVSHWIGFFAGGCIIILGGFLDDKYDLKPWQQIIFPILAAACVIGGGVSIEKVTNPFGGFFYLDAWRFSLPEIGGSHLSFDVLSDVLIMVWLMVMMYSTKLLDGLDGLVSGVSAIGAFIIFVFTMTSAYYQPDLGTAALLLSGAFLGFLVFNWNPASIFLGEGGSLFAGYSLGVISIISGGKIAIALLVMGIPLLDMVWTIVRRLASGKNPFRFSDKLHLHFRLFDLGFGQKGTVLIYYLFSLLFGASAVFLQSREKLFALILLVLIMVFAVAVFAYADKKKKTERTLNFKISRSCLKTVTVTWALFILVMISFPMESHPDYGLTFADKIVHFMLFGIMAFLLAAVRQGNFVRRAVFAGVVAFTYSIACEIIQIFVPGRSSSVEDLFAGLAGISFFLIIDYVRENKK